MDWKPNREPDFDQFLRVLKRERRPRHLPFYEHIASAGFIACRTGTAFDQMPPNTEFWRIYVDFWLGLGFDEIPMEIPLNCPLHIDEASRGKATFGSESRVTIRDMADFEAYPWPDVEMPIDFSHFETVAQFLPESVKIVGGVSAGPYEWATYLLGVEGLAVALYMNPELAFGVLEKLGERHISAVRQLASMDFIGALRQGDDLGFKTATFLPPDLLRKHVLPIYKRMAEEAHSQGKPFILHSCGNLEVLYDDLINYCGIDAKHSFEDVILPVTEFKKRFGRRVTPLGGLDVDCICRMDEPDLRAYTRRIVEQCYEDGFWALGTGNSLTDYMPVGKYLIVLDEGLKATS